MKKQKYRPYFFDYKYELKTYKRIGLDYGDSVTANKGCIQNARRWFRKHIYNRANSKYKICNTYEDWEIHVKSRLPMRTDYKNYLHWLIKQKRFAESDLEIVKAILIPIYIALLSMKDVFFNGKTLDFWNDWIEIVHSVM